MFSFLKSNKTPTTPTTTKQNLTPSSPPATNISTTANNNISSNLPVNPTPAPKKDTYIQLFNADGDIVFLALATGFVTWKLPSYLNFDNVKYFSHINDADGRLYWEDMKTGQVTWSLPADDPDITILAKTMVADLDNMSRQDTEVLIGQPFSEDMNNATNEAIDEYLAAQEEKRQQQQQQNFDREAKSQEIAEQEPKPPVNPRKSVKIVDQQPLSSTISTPMTPVVNPPMPKVLIDEYYIQSFNNEGDPVFVGLKSGNGYWTLPNTKLFEKVKLFAHINEEDGRLYFEDCDTNEVTWHLVVDNHIVFKEGFDSVSNLDNLDRSQTEDFVQEIYDEGKIQKHNEELDNYLEEKEEKKKIQQELAASESRSSINLSSARLSMKSTDLLPLMEDPGKSEIKEKRATESNDSSLKPKFVHREPVYHSENYIQSFNADGDTVFIGLSTGTCYWGLLPKVSLNKILIFSHVNDEGKLYFESADTGEVTWTLPINNINLEISDEAREIIQKIDSFGRSETETMIGVEYNEDYTMNQNDEVDRFLEHLDDLRKIKMEELRKKKLREEKLQEEKRLEEEKLKAELENKHQDEMRLDEEKIKVEQQQNNFDKEKLNLDQDTLMKETKDVEEVHAGLTNLNNSVPKKSVPKEKFMQSFNVEGDTVLIGLLTGQLYWSLPIDSHLDEIIYLTHLNDDGHIYFEEVSTGNIFHSAPTIQEGIISQAAHRRIISVEPMTRQETEQLIGVPFNEETTERFNQSLEAYLLNLDELKKQKEIKETDSPSRRTSFNHFGGDSSSALQTLQTSSKANSILSDHSSRPSKVVDDPIVVHEGNQLVPCVVQAGYLKKLATQSGRNWKKRYIVLTSFTVAYYETEKQFSNNVKSKGEVLITSDAVINIVQTPGEGFGFKFSNKTESITFAAINDEERKKWMQQIKTVILKNKSFLKSSSFNFLNKLPSTMTPEKLFSIPAKVAKSYEVKKFLLLSKDNLYCFKEINSSNNIFIEWELKLNPDVQFYVIYRNSEEENVHFLYLIGTKRENQAFAFAFRGNGAYEFNVWKDAIYKYTKDVKIIDEAVSLTVQDEKEPQAGDRKSLSRINKALDSLFRVSITGGKEEEKVKTNELSPRRNTRQNSLIRSSIRQSTIVLSEQDKNLQKRPSASPGSNGGDALAIAAARKLEKQKSINSPSKSILVTKRDSSNRFLWDELERANLEEEKTLTSDSMQNHVSTGTITENTSTNLETATIENVDLDVKKSRSASMKSNIRKSIKILNDSDEIPQVSALHELFETVNTTTMSQTSSDFGIAKAPPPPPPPRPPMTAIQPIVKQESNPKGNIPPPPPPPPPLSTVSKGSEHQEPVKPIPPPPPSLHPKNLDSSLGVPQPPPPPPPPLKQFPKRNSKAKEEDSTEQKLTKSPSTLAEMKRKAMEKINAEKQEKVSVQNIEEKGLITPSSFSEGKKAEDPRSSIRNSTASASLNLKGSFTLEEGPKDTNEKPINALEMAALRRSKKITSPDIQTQPPEQQTALKSLFGSFISNPLSSEILEDNEVRPNPRRASMRRKSSIKPPPEEIDPSETESKEDQQETKTERNIISVGSSRDETQSKGSSNALEMMKKRKERKSGSGGQVESPQNSKVLQNLFGDVNDIGSQENQENQDNLIASQLPDAENGVTDQDKFNVSHTTSASSFPEKSIERTFADNNRPVSISIDADGVKLNALEAAKLRKKLKESGIQISKDDKRLSSERNETISKDSSKSMLQDYRSYNKANLIALTEFLDTPDAEIPSTKKDSNDRKDESVHLSSPVTQNTINAIRRSSELKEKRRQSLNGRSSEEKVISLQNILPEAPVISPNLIVPDVVIMEETEQAKPSSLPTSIQGVFGFLENVSDDDDENDSTLKREQNITLPSEADNCPPDPPLENNSKHSIRDAAMKNLARRPSSTHRQQNKKPPTPVKWDFTEPEIKEDSNIPQTTTEKSEITPPSKSIASLFNITENDVQEPKTSIEAHSEPEVDGSAEVLRNSNVEDSELNQESEPPAKIKSLSFEEKSTNLLNKSDDFIPIPKTLQKSISLDDPNDGKKEYFPESARPLIFESTHSTAVQLNDSGDGGYVNALDLFKMNQNKPLVKLVFEKYSFQHNLDVTSFQQFSYDFGYFMPLDTIVSVIKEHSALYQRHAEQQRKNLDESLKLSYEDFLVFWRSHPVFR